MKLTLLEMTKSILNDMDSDNNITDITDTIEAEQVAQILKDSYYDIINIRNWDFLNVYRQLTDANSASTPTKFTIPEEVGEVFKFWYRTDLSTDSNQEWTQMKYLHPQKFVDFVNARGTGNSDVTAVDTGSGATLNITTDKMPQYWTSFDDNVIWCDSYDSDEETFLTEERTKIFGKEEPTWTASNSFEPTMNAEIYPFLLNEAKSRAFLLLKQMPNEKAEKWSKRLYRKYRALGNRTDEHKGWPDWGI